MKNNEENNKSLDLLYIQAVIIFLEMARKKINIDLPFWEMLC